MIDGVVRNIAWNKYEAPNFKPYLNPEGWWHMSCASAALSTITGIIPVMIDAYARNATMWSTRSMRTFLQKKGYEVITVSRKTVTNVHSHLYTPLNERHVILACCYLDLKEDGISAFVSYGGHLYHNFREDYNFGPLFFLNKPLEDVLVIFNKKWKGKAPEKSCKFVRPFPRKSLTSCK